MFGYEPEGRGFESLQVHQSLQSAEGLFFFSIFSSSSKFSKATRTASTTKAVKVQSLPLIVFSTSSTTSSHSNEEKQTKEKFSLVDSEGSYDGFAYYINGSIVNNTDKQYSYVQVTFNLYDASGAQIGTALANINNLDPNGTWKFKAMGGTQNAASYKLAEITGW